MLPFAVIELRYYQASDGRSPFELWFSELDTAAAAKVSIALARLEQANFSNAKAWGTGFLSIASIGDPGTASISDETGMCW